MPAPRLRLHRTVIVLSIVSLLTDVSSEMIFPLVPVFLAATLGANARLVGAIEGSAEAVAALLKYFSGRWSDGLARRKPLVLAGYTLSSVVRPLIGLAQSGAQVFMIRVGDRIGKGIRSAPRDAMIADATKPEDRGRAFSIHRAADHVGAMIGPLIAFALLQWLKLDLRTVFLIAALPAALAVIALLWGVREEPRINVPQARVQDDLSTPNAERGTPDANHRSTPATTTPLGRPFFRYLVVLAVFTLGNSTDAFLLLRANELGVAPAAIPLLWALLHVVKAGTSVPGGVLSDRVGRLPLIRAGWAVYGAVYLGFGLATTAWHAWALFAAYGVFYGLTEGVEKALVADLVPAAARGRAFGWYNMALGLAVLPAALVFGWIWDARGSVTAFAFGAAIAGVSAVALPFAVGRRSIGGR